ncbi:MAG TPA: sigma-70 family RNA polymerase sigma factor [Mesorhizobium sp.]|jgi:RNA polymerase sigma-70 factor (ECF subfamily)|nr:sigma-70 family RNA polymerase sigma factor [Mesorhizobium sp.]
MQRRLDQTAGTGFDYADALRRCAKGERAALRLLYEQDAGAMLGVAARILRRRDLAEEAVQDTFVQVWRRAASFDPARGAGRAWLFTILRHRALNILRDGGREEATDADLLADEPDDAPDPEAVVVALDEASRLRRCLEGLEPQRRQGLVLAYTFGMSHGEVAATLRVPLGTAKSWIRRAFLQVRECMR